MSLHQVIVHKIVTDIWTELGLEEIPNEYSDSDILGWSRISDGELIDDDECPCPRVVEVLRC